MRPQDYPGISATPVAVVELGDEEETRALGRWLATEVKARDFIGLIGDLGAGKTTLMKGFTAALSKERTEALSPTYSLIQVYETAPPIIHMDLYRLETFDDLESIGYWDYVDGEGILCVEWLDRIPDAWPERGIIVELTRQDEGRVARIWASQKRADSMGAPELSIDANMIEQERK